MRNLIREAFCYSAASGVALVVDVSLLWMLVEWFHWYYLAAAAVSFIAGTVVVYVVSVSRIFKHRRVADRRIEFVVFATIGALGVLVNLIVLKIAVDHFHVHYLVGKMASIVFTFTMNFGLRRTLLFSAPAPTRLPTGAPRGRKE